MNNLTLEQLEKTWEVVKFIPSYQRILEKGGYSWRILNLLDDWEEAEMRTVKIAEESRYEELQKIRKEIKEFKEELGDEGIELRLVYLKEQKGFLEKIISEANIHNKEMKESFYSPTESLSWLRFAIMSLWKLEERNRKLKKITSEIRFKEHREDIKEGKITQEMIEKARRYPFEQLVDLSKGKFIFCPFHKERTASFYIKNNFGFCFGCNKSADTIEFLMKTQNYNFIDAVKALQ